MSLVKVTQWQGFSVVSINRPETLNALNRAVVDELDAFLDDVEKDDSQRALILFSEENFAAGADIREMVACGEAEARRFAFSPTFLKLAALSIPTIALIDGYALGGGLELALSCDLRIASETAQMGFPEINLGIMPGAGGTIRAPRIIGSARASELIFTGKVIHADEALAMGLVNEVVSQGELLARGIKLAEKLAAKAPQAIETAKKTMERGLSEMDLVVAISEIEADSWADLFNTEDQEEGMKAFLEKRKPVYTGKRKE